MYQVVIEIATPGKVYMPKIEAHRFTRPRFCYPISEGFIPAQGDVLDFKHEGQWWSGTISEKILTIFPPTKHGGGDDYLVTLKIGTVYQIEEPTWENP